jgi:hypothetical protein
MGLDHSLSSRLEMTSWQRGLHIFNGFQCEVLYLSGNKFSILSVSCVPSSAPYMGCFGPNERLCPTIHRQAMLLYSKWNAEVPEG